MLAEIMQEGQEPEIGLRDLILLLRSHGVVAFILGLILAALVGIYFFVLQPKEYTATAEWLQPIEAEEGNVSQEAHLALLRSQPFARTLQGALSPETQEKIAALHLVEGEVTLEDLITFSGEMGLLRSGAKRNSDVITISATTRDAELSAELSNLVSEDV